MHNPTRDIIRRFKKVKIQGATDFVRFGRAVLGTGASVKAIEKAMHYCLGERFGSFTPREKLEHFRSLSLTKNMA